VGVRASGSMAVEGPSLRRRVGAVVVAVMVAASLVPLLAGPAQAAGRFTDDDGSVHEPNIEFIAARGITQGCSTTNPDLFCPNDPVTRGQMASFLARALGLPPATTDFFPDDSGSVHEDNINRIAQAGITGGFADGTYRPNDLVTRGQMASFIARGFDLPPATTDFFPDDSGSVHEDNINRIAQAGITTGFPDGTYRPNDTVTRGQMASFLRRAIDYTTTGTTSTTSTTVPATTSSTTPPTTTGSTTSTSTTSTTVVSGPSGAFVEEGGVVVMEVESVKPGSGGYWVEETQPHSGWRGRGYLIWRGPQFLSQPGRGTLTYTMVISTPGVYKLRIRSLREWDTANEPQPENDKRNDVWVRMNSGEWYKTSRQGEWNQWGWNQRLSLGDGEFAPMEWRLDAGVHQFQISGRSERFAIDRIHAYLGTTNPGVTTPESPRIP
jgi:hypothetical protein